MPKSKAPKIVSDVPLSIVAKPGTLERAEKSHSEHVAKAPMPKNEWQHSFLEKVYSERSEWTYSEIAFLATYPPRQRDPYLYPFWNAAIPVSGTFDEYICSYKLYDGVIHAKTRNTLESVAGDGGCVLAKHALQWLVDEGYVSRDAVPECVKYLIVENAMQAITSGERLNRNQKRVYEYIRDNPDKSAKKIASALSLVAKTITDDIIPEIRRKGYPIKNEGSGYYLPDDV